MTGRPIGLSFDNGEVGSGRFLEIPIKGPGSANLLVMIDGLAISPIDGTPFNAFSDDAEFHIATNYRLRDQDEMLDASAYACLAEVQADDEPDTGSNFSLTISGTGVVVATTRVIQLQVSAQLAGDTALMRIGYRLNVVLHRTF